MIGHENCRTWRATKSCRVHSQFQCRRSDSRHLWFANPRESGDLNSTKRLVLGAECLSSRRRRRRRSLFDGLRIRRDFERGAFVGLVLVLVCTLVIHNAQCQRQPTEASCLSLSFDVIHCGHLKKPTRVFLPIDRSRTLLSQRFTESLTVD